MAKLTSKSIVTAALAFHTLLLLTYFSCYCSDFECNLNTYPNSGPPGVDFAISGFSRLDRDVYIGT